MNFYIYHNNELKPFPELEYPPCKCKWCEALIGEFDFFARDSIKRVMCVKCKEIEKEIASKDLLGQNRAWNF